jgi:DNA-binding MarR family transcriptional regulator
MSQRSDWVDAYVERLADLPEEERPNLEVEAFVSRLHALSRSFRRAMASTQAREGVGVSDMQLLTRLRLAPDVFGNPTALSRASGLTPGAITNRLDALEQRGYVRRHAAPGDRRGVVVELTPEGRAAWNRVVGEHAPREAAVASVLTPAEQRKLNELLRKLVLAFDDPV